MQMSPRTRGWLATLALPALCAFVVACGSSGGGDDDDGGNESPATRVATRNLYLGADLTPALTAGSPEELAVAATDIWEQVQATNFTDRAAALAAEIDDESPVLVGLQEAALWRSGTPDGPPAFGGTAAATVEQDFLSILLDALEARGLVFNPRVIQEEADLEAPTTLGFDIRLTLRDVILVRAGLTASELSVSNPQLAHYATNAVVPIAGTPATVELTRGWTALDVTAKGRSFRFVNTHLEAVSNAVRSAQASELLAGPLATTTDPIVLVGDLNSAPDDPVFSEGLPSDATNPYDILTGSGFADPWVAIHPEDPGHTCCHDADLLNAEPTLVQRIDHVLMRDGEATESAVIVGTDPDARTADLLWPSDHAGVVTTLLP